MAAASKRFGYAREEKVMKEIRGGLPEQYSNKGFCWSFIGLFIVCVFFGILLCREGTGICETVIGIGFMYLVVLYIYLRFSVSYVIDETGVTITYINFKYGQFISTGMSTMKWNLEQREKMRPV